MNRTYLAASTTQPLTGMRATPVYAAAGHACAKLLRDAELKEARLWTAMKAAKAVDIDEGCQLITLPDDADGHPVYWPGLDSNTLFVRPDFKMFFEELLNSCQLTVKDKRFRTLLRGVPGIGKSTFGL